MFDSIFVEVFSGIFQDKQLCQILLDLTEIKDTFVEILISNLYLTAKWLLEVTDLRQNIYISLNHSVEKHFKICQNLIELLIMKNLNGLNRIHPISCTEINKVKKTKPIVI